jgi:two-component system, sensor histidine kinase
MCRILVVDDDPAVLTGLQMLIGTWGCEVVTAASTEEAVKQVGEGVDAVVADYRLRGTDTGLAAVHAIYERMGHSVPAVIITGDTAAQRLQQLRDSGLPVRHKPIMPKELWGVLADQLAGSCEEFRRGVANGRMARS